MRDKAILEIDGTLQFVPDCYKNQIMCNQAVDNYAHNLEYVPRNKSQEIYNKAVDTCSVVFHYVADRYKTQEMGDKVVDEFLPTLNFVPDWFVTNKMIKKLIMLIS